jgi:hypothetical protein
MTEELPSRTTPTLRPRRAEQASVGLSDGWRVVARKRGPSGDLTAKMRIGPVATRSWPVPRSHPRKRGPCSAFHRPPEAGCSAAIARVLVCAASERIAARAQIGTVGYIARLRGRIPASGAPAQRSDTPSLVASPRSGRVDGWKRGPSGDLTPETRMGSASTRRAIDRLHGRIPQAGPCSTFRRSLLHVSAHLPLKGRGNVFPAQGDKKSPSPSGGRLGWGWGWSAFILLRTLNR